MSRSSAATGAVVRALRGGRSFVLPLHAEPDGDSVGSSIALAMALDAMGKQALVVSKDPVPATLAFLPGVDRVRPLESWDGSGDVAVLIDVSDAMRTGIERDRFAGMLIVNIDHHRSNDGFAEVRLVDREAASSSELVYDIILALGLPITPDIAVLLYAGIMTDTGSFRYSNTSVGSLRAASDMVALGADPAAIARQIYEVRTHSSLKLMGYALSNLKTSKAGTVAWIVLPQSAFRQTGALETEAEGVVTYTRMIPGVRVGAILREMSDGTVKVGLRSDGSVNVADIAGRYGGGGHNAAAGCSLCASLGDAEASIVADAMRATGETT